MKDIFRITEYYAAFVSLDKISFIITRLTFKLISKFGR